MGGFAAATLYLQAFAKVRNKWKASDVCWVYVLVLLLFCLNVGCFAELTEAKSKKNAK